MPARTPFALLLAVAVGSAGPLTARAACDADSGTQTTALVELYTSEGCSSCPPADQQLRRLHEAVGASARIVPLALHVDYWDALGWKDPFAKAAFGERQSRLVGLDGGRVVYTPHFFVNGTELGPSRSDLSDAVRRRNAAAAAAALHLHVGALGRALSVGVDVTLADATVPAELYIAVAENGLSTKVTRGENSGETLVHDHVVREWIGPIAVNAKSGRVTREIAIAQAWNPSRLEVVGFVENRTTGEVLQAVSLSGCVAPS